MQDSLVLSSLLLALAAGFDWLPFMRMFTFLEELLLSQLVGVVYPESAFTGLEKIKVKYEERDTSWWGSYLSSGQGLTRDTLEEVTEAEDLWLQSLERKNPDKKPRTADASPVRRAIVTAWNRTDQCDCVTESLLVRIFFLPSSVAGSGPLSQTCWTSLK